MSARVISLALFAIVAVSCSPSRETAAGLPTSPSAIVPGGTLALVTMPARSDTLDFRRQLESKYASMGRTQSQVYVDQEGDATWIGEYQRYRTNGCDHNTATQRALEQIDGAAPGPICSLLQFPETAVYPSRDQLADFRRQLGAKYQSMGRSAQSAVDQEGAGIWVGDYLRYRSSGCDHQTAVQNTLTQVDGNAAPPSCLQACAYSVSPGSSTVPSGGGSFSTQLVRSSGSCEWIATGSDVPWMSLRRPITGGDRGVLNYSVDANTATSSRSGTIRVEFPGGRTQFVVTQSAAGSNLAFQMFDPVISATNPTTECQIKTTGTVCTLTARDGNLPAPAGSYDWLVEYNYNGAKQRTQSGNLPTFSFSETCSNTAAGTVIPMTVRMIANGAQGNSVTLYSGQGSQPSLQLRIFACS